MKKLMMKSVTASQMKRLDRLASEKFGISTLVLMENAGRGIADLAERVIPVRFSARIAADPSFGGRRESRAEILIVCGKGNNGGDGFVAARHLFNRGYQIQVVVLVDPRELKGDTIINYKILKNMRIPILSLRGPKGRSNLNPGLLRSLRSLAMTADLIIDAIFGTGLKRKVTGLASEVIFILNRSGKKILSVDIPSGLHADTGRPMGSTVCANITGTLALPKSGMMHSVARKYTGKIKVLDISIPAQLL